MAGRVGQEFNRREGRKGAYWEDRYHGTAVERGGASGKMYTPHGYQHGTCRCCDPSIDVVL